MSLICWLFGHQSWLWSQQSPLMHFEDYQKRGRCSLHICTRCSTMYVIWESRP